MNLSQAKGFEKPFAFNEKRFNLKNDLTLNKIIFRPASGSENVRNSIANCSRHARFETFSCYLRLFPQTPFTSNVNFPTHIYLFAFVPTAMIFLYQNFLLLLLNKLITFHFWMDPLSGFPRFSLFVWLARLNRRSKGSLF